MIFELGTFTTLLLSYWSEYSHQISKTAWVKVLVKGNLAALSDCLESVWGHKVIQHNFDLLFTKLQAV